MPAPSPALRNCFSNTPRSKLETSVGAVTGEALSSMSTTSRPPAKSVELGVAAALC